MLSLLIIITLFEMGQQLMGRLREEQIQVKGDVMLEGTVAIPTSGLARYPAIIIISGSGGADRDGNMKKPPLVTNLYKDLAYFLTELDFITLRYDKRGVGESEGDLLKTGMTELVDDIKTMITFLKQHPQVDPVKIILLGHSEGCVLATKVNAEMPVAGLILIAGAGTNLKDPIIYQNRQMLEEIKRLRGLKGKLLRILVKEDKIMKQTNALFNKMEQSTTDFVKYKLKKVPAKWFREHFRYRTEEVLNDLMYATCPILAVTGDKDVQANVDDLKVVKGLGNETIKTVIIKNMNHMLKEFKGEKTVLNLMKQYKQGATAPIHGELKQQLKIWLTSLK